MENESNEATEDQMNQDSFGLHNQHMPSAADSVHVCHSSDNYGPFIKIYYDQRENHPVFNMNSAAASDAFNNYPQSNLFQSPVTPQPYSQSSNSVIHHLVTSNLGPGKFNTFGANNNYNYDSMSSSPLNISIPSLLEHVKSNSATSSAPSKLYKSNMSNNNVENITPNAQGNNRKMKQVAEVKPMRMSYSDVVSKNAMNNDFGSTPSPSSVTTPASINSTKTVKTKLNNFDKNRKSPTTEMSKKTVKHEKPLTPPSVVKHTNLSGSSINSSGKKQKASNVKDSTLKTPKSTATNRPEENESVKNNKYITDSERSSTLGSEEEDDDDDEYDDEITNQNYYNIRKNVYQGEHHKVEKIKVSGFKKSKQQQQPTANSISSKKSEKIQKRSGKISNRKQKHEFLKKLLTSCLEYIFIFAKWLWMLVFDVSYMSFGIVWDRLDWYFQSAKQGIEYARRELKGNPVKSLIGWFKSVWIKFDSKFDKKSKWAIWRWKQNSSSEKSTFKDGKLPKTAEEAMKSLLNCKEKDAYSILGVNPDCPQEQIKKHYKKIAVLVHPDKNKQPGAEEAFKILQRSFELIGETENRKIYDENLEKALHTEKAFTELNDLLVQLQTKISEAANTIRCSACCFRHPRKFTGRKAFAARECKTCKIRHAGREGDIWAETTFFGLRWKYLALMEGNVYDITEWALCQRGALSHLQPNSCVVQYKIVLGASRQQTTQESFPEKSKKDYQANENIDNILLNNIYAGQSPPPQQHHSRRRGKKN